MMITAQARGAEYADELGRCEDCGTLTPVEELAEVGHSLLCEDCQADVTFDK